MSGQRRFSGRLWLSFFFKIVVCGHYLVAGAGIALWLERRIRKVPGSAGKKYSPLLTFCADSY